jgi:hypothetical protein
MADRASEQGVRRAVDSLGKLFGDEVLLRAVQSALQSSREGVKGGYRYDS